MQRVLRNIFGIYSGEEKNTLRFLKLAIFWAFSTSCFETLADGLFLERVGASSLPLVYLIASISLILISGLVVHKLRTHSPYKILNSVLWVALVAAISIIFLLPYSPPAWFWVAMKIFSRIFFSVYLACAWTFIDQYHDLQDAKRVYSLYSSAYFLGIVLSGLCINLFLEKLGHQLFFGIIAVAISVGLLSCRSIAHKITAIHDDTIEGIFSGDRSGITSLISQILKSPYTIALIALSLVQQIALVVTEFNYMETFEKAFQNPHFAKGFTASNVSEFLGKCRGWISFVNIFIVAFLYRPFLKRVGISSILLLTPTFFLIVYSGWVIEDSPLIAVLGLIAVDGVVFTIEDSSFNLLTKAVPSKLKTKVRIINDSFFEPIGMLFTSLCLFLLTSTGGRWFGLGSSVLLLTFSFIVRMLYSEAIFINLKESRIFFQKKVRDWFSSFDKKEKRASKKEILNALESEKESIKLLSLEVLLSIDPASCMKKLLEKESYFSSSAKLTLLTLIEKYGLDQDPRAIEMVSAWQDETSDTTLQNKALFFLAKRGLLSIEKALEGLNDTDLWVRASAILTLKKAHSSLHQENLALYRTTADKEIDLLLHEKKADEILMGLQILGEIGGVSSAEKIAPFINDESFKIKRSAAIAICKIADKEMSFLTEKLLEELEEESDSFCRINYLDALGKINDSTVVYDMLLLSTHFRPAERRIAEKAIEAMGLKTVPTLLDALKNVTLHDRPRILSGKILARLALPQLKAHLHDILEIEKERAYFYFYYGYTIEKKYPLYDLSALRDALLTSFQSAIDFIIHLLGAAGDIEDPELLVISFHSKNEKIHSNAVETLEKASDVNTFKWILPLVENIPFEEKMRAYKKYTGYKADLSLSELLNKMSHSPSLFDRIVATKLKANLLIPGWKSQLRETMKTGDELFHQFAYELLETKG